MSEDFFDSILPPVKMMVEPQKEALPVVAVSSSAMGGPMSSMASAISMSSAMAAMSAVSSAAKASSTDIEKLWEEIYTSDEPANPHLGVTQLQQLGAFAGGGKLIAVKGGAAGAALMQQHSPAGVNGGGGGVAGPGGSGKVFILAAGGKRKAQFVAEQLPPKEMRIAPGNESRRIFQAALQSRSSITNPALQAQLQQQQQMQQPLMAAENREQEEAEEEAEAHTEVYSQYQPLKCTLRWVSVWEGYGMIGDD